MAKITGHLPFKETILFAYAADHSTRPTYVYVSSGLHNARTGRVLQPAGPPESCSNWVLLFRTGSENFTLAFFFTSVAADLALRLGPDSERSGRKVCKNMKKHFGFRNEANHGKTNTTRRNTATATTRKSPGQICDSPAEKTAKQHKTGPAHQTKNHTNP